MDPGPPPRRQGQTCRRGVWRRAQGVALPHNGALGCLDVCTGAMCKAVWGWYGWTEQDVSLQFEGVNMNLLIDIAASSGD